MKSQMSTILSFNQIDAFFHLSLNFTLIIILTHFYIYEHTKQTLEPALSVNNAHAYVSPLRPVSPFLVPPAPFF